MLLQNLVLYEDGYSLRVNGENDPLFYFFDYDTRSADINMQFQHFRNQPWCRRGHQFHDAAGCHFGGLRRLHLV